MSRAIQAEQKPRRRTDILRAIAKIDRNPIGRVSRDAGRRDHRDRHLLHQLRSH